MRPSLSGTMFVGWSPNSRELSVGARESGFWICQIDPDTQAMNASKILSGAFTWSSLSRSRTKRMAIERIYMSRYREIWVADLDPNLSTAEALGPGRTIEEHYQEMIDLYTRRIDVDPENPDSHISLALVYLDIGNKDKAIEDLNSWAKSARDPSRVARTCSEFGFTRIRENPEFAMELLSRAHEIQPENWFHLLGIGLAHLVMNQWEEAIVRFTESMKLPGGENSLNYFALAMAHGGKGHRDEAMSWYQKAMIQMPTDRRNMDNIVQAVLDDVHSTASSLVGSKTENQ